MATIAVVGLAIVVLHRVASQGTQLSDLFGGNIANEFDEPIRVVIGALRLVALVLAYTLLGILALAVVDADGSTSATRYLRSLGIIAPMFGLAAVMLGLSGPETATRDVVSTRSIAPIETTEHATGQRTMSIRPDRPISATTIDAANEATPEVADADALWTVRGGDSFWSIAEEVVHESTGTEASDAQVADYWRTLIAANETRLVDPSNPDLIFPDQVFVLPPAPKPSS